MNKKEIALKIKRQRNPDPASVHWKTYNLKAKPADRILDLLERIRANRDDSLAFRSNCGHGICGSDAMNINGSNRLACRTLLADLGFPDRVVIRPLAGYAVKKDLVVHEEELAHLAPELDLEFHPDKDNPEEISQEQNNQLERAVNCIECGCCQSACPITWNKKRFPGPQMLTRVARYIFDYRDSKTSKRLRLINSYCSLWNCQTMYNCVEVCPREINITALLSALKSQTLESD